MSPSLERLKAKRKSQSVPKVPDLKPKQAQPVLYRAGEKITEKPVPFKAAEISKVPDAKSNAPIIYNQGRRKIQSARILTKKHFAHLNIPYDVILMEGVKTEETAETIVVAFKALAARHGVSPTIHSYGFSSAHYRMSLNVPHAKEGHLAFLQRLRV